MELLTREVAEDRGVGTLVDTGGQLPTSYSCTRHAGSSRTQYPGDPGGNSISPEFSHKMIVECSDSTQFQYCTVD